MLEEFVLIIDSDELVIMLDVFIISEVVVIAAEEVVMELLLLGAGVDVVAAWGVELWDETVDELLDFDEPSAT